MSKFATTNLLKNKSQAYQQIFQPHTWNKTAAEWLLLSLVGFSLFGLVLGTYVTHWYHPLTTAWKMIVLIWGPVILCTPALYVFSSIRGSLIKLTELVYLLIGAMATSSLVLLALAPLTWFFTWTTDTVEFIQGMNAVFIGLGLIFGLFFFGKGMSYVYQHHKTEQPTVSRAHDVLLLWLILLIIVTIQMSTKLGPWYL